MGQGRRFETTSWSLVLAARQQDSETARAALSRLCEAYWYPLYAFVRRQGHAAEESRDLTQAYFLRLLEKDYLRDVDPRLGKFRSFLLASLKHFLANERERARALKRRGDCDCIALDTDDAERRYRIEPTEELTPDKVFQRRWTLTLLDRVLETLEQECRDHGKQRQFERLTPFLIDAGPQTTYRRIGEELEMSEAAVKVAVHRLRRRFGELLRVEVAETVARPEDVDAEIKDLLAALR